MEASLNIFIDKLLTTAAKRQASHIHLSVSSYPTLRINDELVELTDEKIITADFIKEIALAWLSDEQKKALEKNKSLILAQVIAKKFRVKINFFFQKGFLSATLRIIPEKIPPLVNLGLPKSVYELTGKNYGLIVIAGPYGSGKTTTMVSMIEQINKNRKENIMTIEKPIEYLFTSQKSLIEQREIGRDANSFQSALRYAQQSDVDVVAMEIIEDSSIPLILQFANSGRLAIVNIPTTSSVQTIEHIFSAFPAEERQRAQLLLSESLLAVIVQRLVPRKGGGLVLASEVLLANEAVRSLIREGRVKQITTILQSSRAEGMQSLDQSLAQLIKADEVLLDNALQFTNDARGLRAMSR